MLKTILLVLLVWFVLSIIFVIAFSILRTREKYSGRDAQYRVEMRKALLKAGVKIPRGIMHNTEELENLCHKHSIELP